MNLFDFYRFNKSVTMFKMSKFGQNRLFSGSRRQWRKLVNFKTFLQQNESVPPMVAQI